jgi:hypothetical protein
MGDSADEFEWVGEREIQTATNSELIERIEALQSQVHTLQNDLGGLRRTVHLVLDLQAGIAEEFHPELQALLEEHETESYADETINFETELE